jgi:hypothetical protein
MVYKHSNNTINKKKDKEDKEDKNIKVNLKLNLTDKEELIYAMNHSEKFITQSAEGILYHQKFNESL